MQVPVDPDDAAALAEALAEPVQRPCWRVLVDWNRNGLYDHPLSDLSDAVDEGGIKVNRSSTSTLPDDASLVNGSASAEATVRLTGRLDGTPIAFVLSPFRTDSPLAGNTKVGCLVKIEIGLITRNGPVMLPQLTGPLRNIDIKAEGREVELTVADPAENLRAPITLPVGGLNFGRSLPGPDKQPFHIRTQWIVDHILRKNGYGSPIHPNAKLSMTCHGGLVAEVGGSTTPNGTLNPLPATGDDWWTTGPHGLMASGGTWIDSAYVPVFSEQFQAVAGNGIGFGMWVYHGQNIGSDAAVKFLMQTVISAGGQRIYLLCRGDSGALGCGADGSPHTSVPGSACLPQAWRYLGVHLAFNADGTYTPTTRFMGETTVHAPVSFTPVDTDWRFTARTFVQFHVPMSDIQMWYEPTAPGAADWPGESYDGTLDLERGLNRLTYLPTRVGVDSWELLQEVVAAEFGLIGFDEAGAPFFYQRDSPRLDPGTVEVVLDSNRELNTLDVGLSSDTVRNSAVVETQTRWEQLFQVGFEATDPAQFDSDVGITEYVVQLREQTLGYHAELAVPRINSAQWNAEVEHGFVAVRPDATATEVTTGVTVFAYPFGEFGRDILLRVDNQSGGPVRFATTNNTEALRIYGFPFVEYPPMVTALSRPASVATYGSRALGISKTDWHQVEEQLVLIADQLLDELDEPIGVLPGITCNGDPRVQLGDTSEIRDRAGIAPSITASVVEIERSVSASEGLVDTYGVRPVPAS